MTTTVSLADIRQARAELEGISIYTPLEGARLVVEDVPLSFRCIDCGTPWNEDAALCPSCGSMHRETVAGMELDIESVEVEEQS